MLYKHSKLLIPAGILVLSIIIALGFYLNRPDPKVVDTTPTALLVDAIEVVKEDIRVSVRAQGIVMPRTAGSLTAEVSGRILEVSDQFEVGGFFAQGDTLLRIDQRDYLAAAKAAEAAVASARSNLASEKGRSDVAYQDWVKYSRSVKRSQAATDLALRKPQMEEAQARLDSAQAELDHARDQLDRTLIRAPYDGLFKSKKVDVGQYVNAGAMLAEIFAVDVAELRLALPEHKLNYLELPSLTDRDLKIEPDVQLFAEVAGELQQWPAKIVRTEGVFDDRSRVLFAVAEIADPYAIHSARKHELRMGTFVEANIEGRLIRNLVSLPRHILRAGNRVWVIDQQQRLLNRQVSVLRTDGSDVYITEGLESGELVCASTITGAVPGTQVSVAGKVPSNQGHKAGTEKMDQPVDKKGIDIAPAPQPTPDKAAAIARDLAA